MIDCAVCFEGETGLIDADKNALTGGIHERRTCAAEMADRDDPPRRQRHEWERLGVNSRKSQSEKHVKRKRAFSLAGARIDYNTKEKTGVLVQVSYDSHALYRYACWLLSRQKCIEPREPETQTDAEADTDAEGSTRHARVAGSTRRVRVRVRGTSTRHERR